MVRVADVHVLDEAHLVPVVACEAGQLDDFAVVDAFLDDRVQLDRRQPDALGLFQPFQHRRQIAALGHGAKGLRPH